MAFHFREACANWPTNPVYDPVTQTAEYKACAVNIGKIKIGLSLWARGLPLAHKRSYNL